MKGRVADYFASSGKSSKADTAMVVKGIVLLALAVVPYGPGLSGWRVLGRRLNPFTSSQPVPGIADILNRSTGLSQVRRRRAVLGDDRVDLLLRPPVARLGSLDFKGGITLIDAGYRYAAEALSKSDLVKQLISSDG